jgi:hypothetical protein
MYYITTLCSGKKYTPILLKWQERIKNRCKDAEIVTFTDINKLNNTQFISGYHGFIWALRFKHNIDLLLSVNKPVVMCDLDVIIEKDIQPIVNLSYDIIISTEIGGDKSYPQNCSKILGFGVCCGFMILKPGCEDFIKNIFNNMMLRKYKTYDDQVNIMNHIVNSNYTVSEEELILDNVKYINKIIHIDNIKICVLDFNIIIRDPILNNNQYANHINIDNVGGTDNFLKYFDENLENLPLTCRCGKLHLGDNNICKHINIRNQ